MPRMRKKADLPTRTCATCGKPFAWRRKWARDWANVQYCSERCNREKRRKKQRGNAFSGIAFTQWQRLRA